MQPATLVALLALLATAATQQYGGNYVDSDYDYQEAAPRPAPPRSYSRPQAAPAPARQSFSSSGPRPTPVPILKQINRHNEDGSYTYGYEGADGSFKIETKLQTGEVMGKYGYVDDVGKVRVVEYGANKFGFQPSGEGITVAPPTLVDETRTRRPGDSALPEYDDGQYYQPAPRPQSAPRPAPRPQHAPRPAPRPAPPPQQQFSYDSYQDEQEYSAPRPQPAPRPQQQYSAPRPQQFSAPRPSQGPAPPRAVVPGAAPSPGVTYAAPRPQQSAPRPRPAPQARQAGGGGGILDQLARDYALPQGGHALTDISFGSY